MKLRNLMHFEGAMWPMRTHVPLWPPAVQMTRYVDLLPHAWMAHCWENKRQVTTLELSLSTIDEAIVFISNAQVQRSAQPRLNH